MGTNAPGQLLGYTLQYPRALWYLLTCNIEDNICIEVIGDVGVIMQNNLKLSEEVKSSVNGNPVTNRSSDLWKTFFNWTKAALDGQIDVEKTIFFLYVTKKGKNAIVNSFHNAKNDDSAQIALAAAWEILKTINNKHEIFTYIEFLKKHETVLCNIIKNFEFQVGSDIGKEEVDKAIRAKHVSQNQVEFINHTLMGWLIENVTLKISKKEHAIINWNEFDEYARTVFEKSRRRELIDFTSQYPVNQLDVKNKKLERPPFIRQLEMINGDDEDIQQAVSDYLRANVNRFKWIEFELIDIESAKEFEEKLRDYWNSQKKTIHLTNPTLSNEDKGSLIFHQCRMRHQLIKNQDPPPATIAGTYHLMSNNFSIGWHPNWEDSLLFIKPNADE